MGDFYQNGIVTTLHNLSQRSTDALETELLRFSEEKAGPDTSVLYSELETEAMPKIIEELSRVSYLNQLIIGSIARPRSTRESTTCFQSTRRT